MTPTHRLMRLAMIALGVGFVAGCGGGSDEPLKAAASEPRVATAVASKTGAASPAGEAVGTEASGSLSATVDTTSTGANLTEAGTGDWTHWGDGVPGVVRKAQSSGSRISAYTVLGGTPRRYYDDPRALSWTDGQPTPTASVNTNGVAVSGTDSGFSVSVPAGTSARTAIVYVGGRGSAATFRARLSDGSSADFTETTPMVGGRYDRSYTLTYKSGTPNQRLVLSWVAASSGGSVVLSGVAVSAVAKINHAPLLTTPLARSSVVGQALSLAVFASDADRDALVFSATGLPAGLSIDAGSGVISGTPTDLTHATTTLAVRDGRGGSDQGAFAWDIVATPPATSGLDRRPANLACVAPARPQGGTGVQLSRVFPNLTFSLPVGMNQAPGDNAHWYVTEQQTGRVQRFPNQPSTQPDQVSTFLDLSGRVLVGSETGLLGLAFHPQWPGTLQVFVYYTVIGTSPVENRLSRFTSVDGGASLDPASEQVILRLVKNQNTNNHNGGHIAFGPDGYLYIGTGDGGGAGDPNNNAQNRNVLFGKMLRIDVGRASGYAIPAGNPHAGNPQCANGSGDAPCPEIFATGLRNPWRWSFDRATGDLWVGDVGQSTREEINVVRRGANHGWRLREGSLCFNPSSGCGTVGAIGEPLVDPLVEYGRDAGQAVTGGYVYRGSRVPDLAGRYIFADYASSRLFAFQPPAPLVAATPPLVLTAADTLLTAPQNVTSMAQGNDGELYVVGYGGQLFALQPAGAPVDTIPPLLSLTGCVLAANATQPAAGLVPFSVTAPFWSDGAVKQRWLALPDGTTIAPQTPGHWSPPNGTVLMKSFRLDDKLVETRLLMRHPDGVWAGYTYEWNAAQTDATRVVGGKTKPIGSQTWIYPSENDCLSCHTEVAGRTLGLETAQLNSSLVYPSTGRLANQITTLNTIGMLSPPIAGAPSTWSAYVDPHGAVGTVRERARAFLHSNCSQCHQPGGPTPVELDLRYTTPLAQTGACNTLPMAGDLGLRNARVIAPGAPDRSVLLSRVNRRDASGMPPLGSSVVDGQSVAVLRQWILGLTGCR